MERTKIPYILTIIGTFLMLICIFLPYGSAKKDFADAMREMPDHVEIEELDLTSKDMINISMFKYTRIYYTLSEQVWGDKESGILYVVILSALGGFALIAAFCALSEKPIPIIIFSLLSFGVFCLQNYDYSDRGVLPSYLYNWGIGYYLFYVAFFVSIIGAIWFLIAKHKNNKSVMATK